MMITILVTLLAVWQAIANRSLCDALQDELSEVKADLQSSLSERKALAKQLEAIRANLHKAGLSETSFVDSVKALQTDLVEAMAQAKDLADRIAAAKANASARARAAAIARWSSRTQDEGLPRAVPDCEGQTFIPEVTAAAVEEASHA